MSTFNGSSQFLDLPLEIIEQIINILKPPELLLLAKTCRQFNSYSLRRFFLLHKIKEPAKRFHGTLDCVSPYHREGSLGPGMTRRVSSMWSSLSLQDRGANAFEGLAVAFDITTIEHFRCFLNAPPSTRTESILNVLKKLLLAAQRLERIEKVTLTLERGDHFIRHEGNTDKQAILIQWREVMSALLNVLVERGCQSLEVYNGDFPLQALDFFGSQPNPFLRRGADNGLNLLQRTKSLFIPKSSSTLPTIRDATLVWTSPVRFRHLTVEPYRGPLELAYLELSKAAHTSCQLRRLLISSQMLLHPPCSHWTHSILQTPNLTSLHLFSIHETTWTHIFSWLLPPIQSRLQELSIESCYGIPSEPLINFVIGLQALTHLTLAYPVPVVHGEKLPSSWKPKTTQVLPNLVSLHAFPDWIQLLCPESSSQPRIISLRHFRTTSTSTTPTPPPQTQPPTRPNLQHLHILPRTSWTSRSEFDFELSLNILRPILQSSVFPFNSSTFRVTLELNDAYTISHMARAILQWGGDSCESVIDRQDQMTRKRPELPAGYEPYDHITDLIIYNPGFLQHYQCKVTCEFLSIWKGVKRVELRSLVPDLWNDENVVRLLIQQAKVSCRSVEEFVLGGKVYVVEDSI